MTQHSTTWSYRVDTGNNLVRSGQTLVKRPIYALTVMNLLKAKVTTWLLVVASGYSTAEARNILFSTTFTMILWSNQPSVQGYLDPFSGS